MNKQTILESIQTQVLFFNVSIVSVQILRWDLFYIQTSLILCHMHAKGFLRWGIYLRLKLDVYVYCNLKTTFRCVFQSEYSE